MKLTRMFWTAVSVESMAYLVPIVAFALLYLGTKDPDQSLLATRVFDSLILLAAALGIIIGIVLGAGLVGLFDLVPRIQQSSSQKEAWGCLEKIVETMGCIFALAFIITLTCLASFAFKEVFQAFCFWVSAFLGILIYFSAMIYCNTKRHQLGLCN